MWGLGFRVQDLGFRVVGIEDLGFRLEHDLGPSTLNESLNSLQP